MELRKSQRPMQIYLQRDLESLVGMRCMCEACIAQLPESKRLVIILHSGERDCKSSLTRVVATIAWTAINVFIETTLNTQATSTSLNCLDFCYSKGSSLTTIRSSLAKTVKK